MTDERPAVFVGVNGWGRSSILDATASQLSWLVARVRSPQGRGFVIPGMDVRNESEAATRSIRIERRLVAPRAALDAEAPERPR